MGGSGKNNGTCPDMRFKVAICGGSVKDNNSFLFFTYFQNIRQKGGERRVYLCMATYLGSAGKKRTTICF